MCPLTPFSQTKHELECSPNHLTYSPAQNKYTFTKFEFEFSHWFRSSQMVYLSVSEYGFSSKIQSARKKKRFVPTTPAKKIKSMATHEIYSPFANILNFDEDTETHKMRVTTLQSKGNKFLTDFEVLSKLGEGSFGEAYRVRSRSDGLLYAIKKAKQKYMGYKDRE